MADRLRLSPPALDDFASVYDYEAMVASLSHTHASILYVIIKSCENVRGRLSRPYTHHL